MADSLTGRACGDRQGGSVEKVLEDVLGESWCGTVAATS